MNEASIEIQEELCELINNANKEKWAYIDQIIAEYSACASVITLIPADKLPIVIEKIKKTLNKGCS